MIINGFNYYYLFVMSYYRKKLPFSDLTDLNNPYNENKILKLV